MAKTIKIPGTEKVIGDDEVFFIAEIGKNFIQSPESKTTEEYLANAIALVDAAVESGADAVKFQTHVCEDEVLNVDFTSPHFNGSDRYSWVSRNEAATPLETFWKPLKAHCDLRGIIFFSTPMSRKAAQKLDELDPALWKVGSGDVQDHVLLNHIIETKKPIIISTGMVSLSELDEVVAYIQRGEAPLSILYCVSQYPCPPEAFNLSTILHFKEKYPDVPIGFSDHSITHDAVRGALQLGAQVIEKHFSFDRSLWGSDHKASVTPAEFKEMVTMAKDRTFEDVDVSVFLGERDRELEGANNQFRPYFNKALVAGADIEVGTVITEGKLFAMRPLMLAGGIPADKVHSVVGKRLKKSLKKFDPITEEILDNE